MQQPPIKILHIITGLHAGGAEMMLYKLCATLDRKMFAPHVIALTNGGVVGDRLTGLGVDVDYLNLTSASTSVGAVAKLVKRVRKLRPDVIQGWMPHGNLAAILGSAATLGRTPVAWNVRQSLDLESGRDAKRTTAWIIRLGAALSWWPGVVIYNSYTGMKQHHTIGYRTMRSVAIPNGFDTDAFVPSPEARASLRAELGLPPDAFLIGLIARFHPMKDHPTFLRAAAMAAERHPTVRFVLVGAGVTSENPTLKSLLHELQLLDRVHLLGQRTDIARLTAALDIATSSSRTLEGFSNSIGEAMSCGVPCVATDVGDASYLVGDTSKVVPPGDVTALVDAWQDVWSLPLSERQRLGAIARNRIISNFSVDSVAAKYAEVYKHVANS